MHNILINERRQNNAISILTNKAPRASFPLSINHVERVTEITHGRHFPC